MKTGAPSSFRLVLLLTAALLAYLFYTHADDLSQKPSGMHTWAQADHYALAQGFVRNDLDFFHPRTACTITTRAKSGERTSTAYCYGGSKELLDRLEACNPKGCGY